MGVGRLLVDSGKCTRTQWQLGTRYFEDCFAAKEREKDLIT